MNDLRRSLRISLSIPVEIAGRDTTGVEIHEKTNTKAISKYGACVILRHQLIEGSEVMVSIPHLDRRQKCRIVWASREQGEKGLFDTGLELESAEDFWGVQFPPEGWVTPKQVPLAGDQRGRFLPQNLLGDNEQQMVTVSSMLNALIAVLEKKGIVTLAELADMLKRMS